MAHGSALAGRKDFSRAVLEFRNAAQVMPKNAEAWYQLGMALVELHEYRRSYAAFRTAVEVDPNHARAQLRIAQMEAVSSDEELGQQAHERLKALAASGTTDAETLNTLAFLDLRAGDNTGGIRTLERALARSPGELRSAMLLARAKLAANDPAGAEAVLKKLCTDAPESGAAQHLLGAFYFRQDRLSEAEARFQRALAIEPGSAASLISLGQIHIATGRKQEAEKTFRRVSRLDKNYRTAFGDWLLYEGRIEEGVREYERLLAEDTDDRGVRTQLVAIYRAVNRPDDANRVIDAALERNAKDVDALLQRSETSIADEKYAEAENDLNAVLKLQPNSGSVHYAIAKLHRARGSESRYRESLYKALEVEENLLLVRLELAQALTSANNFASALHVVDSAPAAQKLSLPLLVQRNWILWARGDLKAMRSGIDAGLARSRTAELLLQDGLLKFRTGDVAGSRAAFGQALKIDSGDLRAMAALSRTYIKEEQTALALQKVREYAARQPKSAPVQELLGMLLVVQGERAEARAAFEAAKTADPAYTRAELSLIQLDLSERKWDDVRQRLESLVAAHPASPAARMWLANFELMKGNRDTAFHHFRKVADEHPGNAQALNNLAYALMEFRRQPDEALKYAWRAQELDPDNSEYADTLGWILYQKGRYAAAIEFLERAAGTKDARAVWQYHLAMAYAKSGDLRSARTTLQAALKRDPSLPEAKLALNVIAQADH